MKLELFDDKIQAFKGKTWKERKALRALARKRDRTIIWLDCLLGALMVSAMVLCRVFLDPESPKHSVYVWGAVYFVSILVIAILFHALFVRPRIRKALESNEPPSA